jgi:hypothetical protein
MSRDVNALATAEQVRAIADGAHDMLLDALNEDWDDVEHEATDRLPLAFSALVFCARAAKELEDPSLFDSIADAFALRVELEIYEEDDLDVLRDATATLLAARARIDDRVIELAGDSSADVRRSIAEGLRPAVPGAMALLRKLVADPDPAVREAARESLGDAAETPWWTGMLSADPVAVLGETVAARVRPVLDEILRNLTVPAHARPSALAAITELAPKLPAPLAADVAAHALTLVDHLSRSSIEPLTALVLAGSRPDEALARLATHWAACERAILVEQLVANAVAALPARRRAECCRALAQRALGAPLSERLDSGSGTPLVAKVAGRAWPKQLDYGFVLDGVDALEREVEDDDELDLAVNGLDSLLAAVPPRAEHVPRLTLRFLQPPSGSWRQMRWSIGTHLAKLDPPVLRPIAERAAASAEPDLVRWGIEALAGKARRKTEPLLPLLEAWTADPRLCSAVARSRTLRKKALALLRRRLRRGELAFEPAVEVILEAGETHGDLGGDAPGPASSRLALRDDEWAAYRAARDRETNRDFHFWYRSLTALPPGSRHPADRAHLARAIDAARDEREWIPSISAALLAELPDAGSLAQATALLAFALGDDRVKVRGLCDTIAQRLGVPPPPDPGTVAAERTAAPARPAREWMDEPELED